VINRDGKLDENYLVYELGDLIYYWTCLCAESGQAPSDMLAKSRTNIEGRLADRRRVSHRGAGPFAGVTKTPESNT
jgi:phosphoribosyl-ATP pyrophosphohydrolase